jgi:hypothetical protein
VAAIVVAQEEGVLGIEGDAPVKVRDGRCDWQTAGEGRER